MKKTSFAIAALFSASLPLAACGSGDGRGADDESITLRAATGLSEKHAYWDGAMTPWMDRVEELTDGQVTFETFTSGELVEVPQEIQAVQDGTIDVAIILPVYKPAQFPMAEVTMLPISSSDVGIASEAYRKLLESDVELADGKTYYQLQFDDNDLKAWGLSTTGEYSISTTGKPLDSVKAVQDASLRTASPIHELYANKIDANSVTIPGVEMYDALSRGAFDGAFYSVADWSGYGFQDLFKWTLTDIDFGHYNASIGMSQQTWEGLPKNVQKAMDQAYEDSWEGIIDIWFDRREEAIEVNKENGGEFVSFNTLDAPVQELFESGVEETWTDYIELLEEKGLPGKKVVLLWRDILVAEGGEVPKAIAEMD